MNSGSKRKGQHLGTGWEKGILEIEGQHQGQKEILEMEGKEIVKDSWRKERKDTYTAPFPCSSGRPSCIANAVPPIAYNATKITFMRSQKRNYPPRSQFPHSCVCE